MPHRGWPCPAYAKTSLLASRLLSVLFFLPCTLLGFLSPHSSEQLLCISWDGVKQITQCRGGRATSNLWRTRVEQDVGDVGFTLCPDCWAGMSVFSPGCSWLSGLQIWVKFPTVGSLPLRPWVTPTAPLVLQFAGGGWGGTSQPSWLHELGPYEKSLLSLSLLYI